MKQVTAVLIGAGQRGMDVYAKHALNFPNEIKFVGVVEPLSDRRERFCKLYNVDKNNAFSGENEFFRKEKLADCVIVANQDRDHYYSTIEALKKGYHVLCEKPMSNDPRKIIEMGMASEKYGRILQVCHVLRYAPFMVKLKQVLDSNVIGDIISVQWIESVGYWHQAHSFVRGNWRSDVSTSPMILAKCCHDFDLFVWLLNSKCKKLSSFGELTYFKKENMPKDAPEYCLDGCPHSETCPYYCVKIYLEDKDENEATVRKVVSDDTSPEKIIDALKKGPYGRCVFQCDNNVVDHQVVNMVFENGVTIDFSMCAFTTRTERVINIMGTKGQIKGNIEDNRFIVDDFRTLNKTTYEIQVSEGGHSGSDISIMREFIKAVSSDNGNNMNSGADKSVESHLIALAAEDARKSSTIIDMNEWKGKLLKDS